MVPAALSGAVHGLDSDFAASPRATIDRIPNHIVPTPSPANAGTVAKAPTEASAKVAPPPSIVDVNTRSSAYAHKMTLQIPNRMWMPGLCFRKRPARKRFRTT